VWQTGSATFVTTLADSFSPTYLLISLLLVEQIYWSLDMYMTY
jgi:hypothetical protein